MKKQYVLVNLIKYALQIYFINNWLIQLLTIWGTIKYQSDHAPENVYKRTFRVHSLQWKLSKKYKKLIL